MVLLLASAAGAAAPMPGADYRVLDHPAPVGGDGPGVEVAEWFWYGCPHCYRFDPELRAWVKKMGDRIHLVRLPAVARQSWQPMAAAFLIARRTGHLDQVHTAFFDAIHKGGKSPYKFAWARKRLERLGVSAKRWKELLHSDWMQSQGKRLERLEQAHGVRAVPTLVIQGRYVVSNRMVGSHQRMLEVAKALVDRIRSSGSGGAGGDGGGKP